MINVAVPPLVIGGCNPSPCLWVIQPANSGRVHRATLRLHPVSLEVGQEPQNVICLR